MKISELIAKLKDFKASHGDIEVKVQSLSHVWDPEPEVREGRIEYWVLLNP